MRARRIVDVGNFALSFLPTSLSIGVSLNSVRIPSKGRPVLVRFFHIYLPLFFATFSWKPKQ